MRRRGLGGGSGRRRGNLSSHRGPPGDSGDGAVMGGGGDEEDDEPEDEAPEDDDERPTTKSSRRRRGRSSAGDDDDRASDRARDQADAEKKQLQTLLMIGIPVGLILLIVLGLMMSGESKHESEDDTPQGPAAIKRVDVDIEDVRRLGSDAKAAFRDAMAVEGDARTARLEQAKRTIDQALELIDRKRKGVPNPAARGPSFDQLDMTEQEINQTFVMVRKGLAEQRQ